MDYLFLLPIAVFAGLPLGILLAWIAKKEIVSGGKYLSLLRRIIIFLISMSAIAMLFTHSIPWVGLVSVIAGIILAVFLNIAHARLERKKYNFNLDYLFLGLCMTSAIAVLEENALLVFSFLCFIYGLAYASRHYKRLKGGWELFAFNSVVFFVPFPFLLLGDVAVVGFGLSAFYLLLRTR
ncbi:MAG: hypothetical protein PHO02_00870 [Candidatus Nanoarchaeia archaeon]|nr:hypothetical protein [Candidatus Nanoarchaeia archaeon]